MKKILFALAAAAIMFAGCTKGFDERLTKLEERVDALEEYVANMNAEVKGIQTIVSNLQKNVYVTGVETLKNTSGAEIGYKLTFNQGNPIEIKHGNTGAQGLTGANGKTPTIDYYDADPTDDKEGNWYWRYADGDWMRDSENNNMIPAYKELEFTIVDGVLYVSIDGAPAISLGQVKGEDGAPGTPGTPGTPGDQGPQGDSWFDDVFVDEVAGTVTISIVGSEHDLVLPFNAAAADEFALNLNLPANAEVVLGGTINISYTLAGCDAKDAGVFVQAPEDWTVALDEAAQKIALTVGEKAGRVVVYAINNVTGEVRAKFVAYDPEAMLIVGVEKSAFYILPDGSGSIEIPVSTGLNYRVEQSDWLTVAEAPATKAMTHKVYTVTAGENTTGNTREGEVTFWTSDGSKLLYTVTVSQKGYNPALLVDGEGNPIKWQETFGLKIGSTTTNFKNDVTLELSDDFTKGTYKVKNMFKAELYYGEGNQMLQNQGADFYADADDNVLTVYKASQKSYSFNSDVTLSVDFDAMTITSSANIPCYVPGKYKDGEIVDYKLEIPAPVVEDDPALAAFVGKWSETYVNKPYSWSSETVYDGEFTVSVVDGKLYFENMFIYKMSTTVYTSNYYGTLSADGTTITLEDENAKAGHGYFGPMSNAGAIVLTVEGNTLKVASAYSGAVANYVATKKVDPLAAFVGKWSETYVNKPYSWSSETVYDGEFTVSVVDGKLYFENMFIYKMYSTVYTANYYGTLSADGTTITLEDENAKAGHGYFGPMSNAGAIVLTVEGNTLKVASAYSGAVANYVATKQ